MMRRRYLESNAHAVCERMHEWAKAAAKNAQEVDEEQYHFQLGRLAAAHEIDMAIKELESSE